MMTHNKSLCGEENRNGMGSHNNPIIQMESWEELRVAGHYILDLAFTQL